MDTVTFVADPVLSNQDHLFALAILTFLCYLITYKIVKSIFLEFENLVYILTALIGFLMSVVFDYILYSVLSVYCV